MIIRDIKNDEEAKKERDTEDDAHNMTGLFMLMTTDASHVPGAWIKKWGRRFKNMANFKSRHFQSVRKDDMPWIAEGMFYDKKLEDEKKKYKSVPYGK